MSRPPRGVEIALVLVGLLVLAAGGFAGIRLLTGNTSGSHIVVVLPGKPDQATVDLVLKRAVMRYRPVLVEGAAAPAAPGATATGPAGTPKDGSDPAWITPDVEKAFTALDCANTKNYGEAT